MLDMITDTSCKPEERFRHFPMAGKCPECGSFETMYVGTELIDEKCCQCGRIVGGGYHAE